MSITETHYTLQFRKINSELDDFRCAASEKAIMCAQEPRNGYLQILITPFEIEQLDFVRFYLQGKKSRNSWLKIYMI